MDKLNWSDNPEYLEALLAGYALGDLSPEEMQQVQTYLEQNPESADELAKLQTTLALLPLSIAESQPSPDLKARILAAAEQSEQSSTERSSAEQPSTMSKPVDLPVFNPTPQNTSPAPKPSTQPGKAKAQNNVVDLNHRRRSRANRSTWMVGSIAAGLLAVLGFQNYRLSQDMSDLKQQVAVAEQQLVAQKQEQQRNQTQLVKYEKTVEMLRQPGNRLMTLKGMEDKSSGSLVIVPMDKKAVLTLQKMPQLPKGQMYRIWAMVKGKKVYCNEFAPNADGSVYISIPLDQLGDAKSVAITIDPQTADTAKPVGDMVMEGAVSI